jgi:O-antigen/teichoic acid export membrane protein
MLSNLALLGIGLLTSVILARTLGPEGRGAYAAILTWPNVIAIVGILGLNQAAIFYCARQPGEARRIVSTATNMALVALTPVLLVAWLAMPLLLQAQAPQTVAAARIFVVVYGVANATWLVAIGGLQGLRLFESWNRLRLGQAVLWLVVLSTAAAFIPATPTVLSFVFALSFLVCVPLALVALGPATGAWAPSALLARPLLRYGISTWIATVPIYLNRRGDQLAMAALVDPVFLGLYAVASSMSLLVSSAIASLASVALPHLASTTGLEAKRASSRRYIRFTVVTGIMCGGAMVAVTPVVIPLMFGPGFAPSILPALILIPASVLQGMATVTEDILLGLDRARLVTRAEGIGVVVTLAGLAWTLPRYPLAGAALTLLATYSVVLLLVLRDCAKQLGGSVRDLVVPTRADWRDVLDRGRGLLSGRI